jgi:hypothetical protein
MSDQRGWAVVARGLELKLAGLILFAGLPVLAALLWFTHSDLRWLFLGLGLAAVPDFAGRCLCLAAPARLRMLITLSVVFQAFAFATLAGFGWTGGGLELGIGLVVASGLQFGAAALFTRFLRAAGEELGRPEVSDRADQLSWRLAYSLAAGWGLGFAAFVAAGVVMVLSIVTCGLGAYFAAPVAGVLLLPVVLLTVGIVVGMYWAYGSTMVRLREAIRGPHDGRPQTAASLDAEPDAAADGEGVSAVRDVV